MLKLIINSEHPEGIKVEVPDEPVQPTPPTPEERLTKVEATQDEIILALADIQYGGAV